MPFIQIFPTIWMPLCGTGALSMCRNRTGPVPGLGKSGGVKESDYLAVHCERSIGSCYPWLRGVWSGPKLKQTNRRRGSGYGMKTNKHQQENCESGRNPCAAITLHHALFGCTACLGQPCILKCVMLILKASCSGLRWITSFYLVLLHLIIVLSRTIQAQFDYIPTPLLNLITLIFADLTGDLFGQGDHHQESPLQEELYLNTGQHYMKEMLVETLYLGWVIPT